MAREPAERHPRFLHPPSAQPAAGGLGGHALHGEQGPTAASLHRRSLTVSAAPVASEALAKRQPAALPPAEPPKQPPGVIQPKTRRQMRRHPSGPAPQNRGPRPAGMAPAGAAGLQPAAPVRRRRAGPSQRPGGVTARGSAARTAWASGSASRVTGSARGREPRGAQGRAGALPLRLQRAAAAAAAQWGWRALASRRRRWLGPPASRRERRGGSDSECARSPAPSVSLRSVSQLPEIAIEQHRISPFRVRRRTHPLPFSLSLT